MPQEYHTYQFNAKINTPTTASAPKQKNHWPAVA